MKKRAPLMLTKQIRFFGRAVTLVCDGRCDKAWGINGRPRTMLSDDPDDYVFKSDTELGVAPAPGRTVGISEGSDLKPSAAPLVDGRKMNRWCARECERGQIGEPHEPLLAPDLTKPEPNRPRSTE